MEITAMLTKHVDSEIENKHVEFHVPQLSWFLTFAQASSIKSWNSY